MFFFRQAISLLDRLKTKSFIFFQIVLSIFLSKVDCTVLILLVLWLPFAIKIAATKHAWNSKLTKLLYKMSGYSEVLEGSPYYNCQLDNYPLHEWNGKLTIKVNRKAFNNEKTISFSRHIHLQTWNSFSQYC